MDNKQQLSAKEAYIKTVEILESYYNGDCLGGNPMCWIEEYSNQQNAELIKENEKLNMVNEKRAKEFDDLKTNYLKTLQKFDMMHEALKEITQLFGSDATERAQQALNKYDQE